MRRRHAGDCRPKHGQVGSFRPTRGKARTKGATGNLTGTLEFGAVITGKVGRGWQGGTIPMPRRLAELA